MIVAVPVQLDFPAFRTTAAVAMQFIITLEGSSRQGGDQVEFNEPIYKAGTSEGYVKHTFSESSLQYPTRVLAYRTSNLRAMALPILDYDNRSIMLALAVSSSVVFLMLRSTLKRPNVSKRSTLLPMWRMYPQSTWDI